MWILAVFHFACEGEFKAVTQVRQLREGFVLFEPAAHAMLIVAQLLPGQCQFQMG